MWYSWFLSQPTLTWNHTGKVSGKVVSSLTKLMVGEDSGGQVVSSILDTTLSWLWYIPMEMSSKHLSLSKSLQCTSKPIQDSSSNLAWGERVESSCWLRTYRLKILVRSEGRLKTQKDSPEKVYNLQAVTRNSKGDQAGSTAQVGGGVLETQPEAP